MREACSLPGDAPAREKQPEGEQIPLTPAAPLSEALLASEKCGCRISHAMRVMKARGERREGRMMEDERAGTMPGL